MNYLFVNFFGLRFFKSYFQNNYVLKYGFNVTNIKEIEYIHKNIHPDIVILFKLVHSLSKNKYIEVSHLCCLACSAVMDSLGFDFRGINTKFEIKWTSPMEVNSNFRNAGMILSICDQFQKFQHQLDEITNH